MKKVIFLAFMLGWWGMYAQQQYAVSVCGTINGIPEGQSVELKLYYQTSTSSGVNYLFALSDSEGNFCFNFNVVPTNFGASLTVEGEIHQACPLLGGGFMYLIGEVFQVEVSSDTTFYFNLTYCGGYSTDSCFVYISQIYEYDDQGNEIVGLQANSFTFLPITYLWNTGDSTEVIYPTTAGLYCVTVTDNTNCVATDCYYYEEAVSYDCQGYIVPFYDLETGMEGLLAETYGTGPYSYYWSTGDTTQFIFPQEEGTYCVTITNLSICCTFIDCYQYGYEYCDCYVYFDYVIQNDVVYFTSYPYGTPPFTYNWYFSDGETSNEANPSHTFADGNYWNWAWLEIIDADGCIAYYYDYILPPDSFILENCYAYFVAYFDDIEGTPGQVFFYDGSYSINGEIVSWLWDFGDGSTSTLQNPSHTYTEEGIYTVTLTITDSEGCQSTYYDVLYINPSWWSENPWDITDSCDANFIILDNDFGLDDIVYIVDISIGDSIDYNWIFDGDFISPITIDFQYPFMVIDSIVGWIDICLIVANQFENCFDMFCDSIYLGGGKKGFGGKYGFAVISAPKPLSITSVPEHSAKTPITAHLYPNPATDKLNLQLLLDRPETITIELVDLMGRTIKTEKVNMTKGINLYYLNTSNLSKGVYFIKLQGKQFNQIQRFIKQ